MNEQRRERRDRRSNASNAEENAANQAEIERLEKELDKEPGGSRSMDYTENEERPVRFVRMEPIQAIAGDSVSDSEHFGPKPGRGKNVNKSRPKSNGKGKKKNHWDEPIVYIGGDPTESEEEMKKKEEEERKKKEEEER